MLPDYNAPQLEEILDAEIALPSFLDEKIYQQDFKQNRTLQWQVNFYLYKKETLALLLNDSDFRKWKSLKRVNWLLFMVVFIYIVYSKVFWLLTFLLIYRYLVSIIISHGLYICIALFTAICSFAFQFNTMDFWFAFVATTLGYLLNKAIADHVEQIIFNRAFMNIHSFWRFYSKKLILIETYRCRNAYDELIKKHPELLDW